MHVQAQTNSPCGFKYGANEKDSIQCLENLVQFRDELQDEHERYIAWQNAVHQCPCSWRGLYGNRIIKLLNALSKKSLDSGQMEHYIDTLIWIPMAHHTYFPDEYSYGRALLFQTLYRSIFRCHTEEEEERVFQDFTTALGMEKEKIPYSACEKYMNIAYKKSEKKEDKTILFDAGKVVLPVAKSAVQQYIRELEEFFVQIDSIQRRIDSIRQERHNRYPDFEWCDCGDDIQFDDYEKITDQVEKLTQYAILKKEVESNWKNFLHSDDYYFNDIRTYCAEQKDVFEFDFEKWWNDIFEPLWKEFYTEWYDGTLETRKKILKKAFEIRTSIVDDDDVVVESTDAPPVLYAEKQPEFPGGPEALQKFLRSETQYPQVAKDAHAQGTVMVQFVVERDGCVSNIKILSAVFPALDQEAIRVCKSMPKWIPGENNDGKKVRVYYRMPLQFSLY